MMQFFIDIALLLIYLWVFLILIAYVWKFWMMYVNEKHLSGLKYVMLEIKLAREINKSPVAFEYVANTLLQGGGVGTTFDRQWKGSLPAISSLEIASLEGTIHFYIRTQAKFRNLVEASLYAQYPNIEVVESDDYTKLIRYEHNKEDVGLWGSSFILGKTWKPTNPKNGKNYSKSGKPEPVDDDDKYEMSADFLPIKTYIDYGLDKDPKEEFKNDPLIPMLEFFGSIGKGEYAWYQLLIQDEGPFNDDKFPKTYSNKKEHKRFNLKGLADDRKKQIRTASWNVKGGIFADEFGVPKIIDSFDKDFKQQFKEETDKDGKTIKVPIKVMAKHLETKSVGKKEMELTPEEKDEIEAIDKKISKPTARCITRVLYLADKSKAKFNFGLIPSVMSNMKPFNGINTFRPKTVSGPYDYDWQNTFKKRVPWRSEELFNDYVERAGFHPHTGVIDSKKYIYTWEDIFFWNFKASTRNLFHTVYETILHPFGHPEPSDVFTLNTEEIATLYHLPGETATVPTLPRIDSIKSKAPTNLPV